MVLNHASLASPDRRAAVEWLKDVTSGMAQLAVWNVAERTLRMSKPHNETLCLADWSLWDALQQLQRDGAREEYSFFLRLTSKIPLLSDVPWDIVSRFRECESKTLPAPDGDPLLLAAITNAIAVGFPSEPLWDKPKVVVTFDELLADARIVEASETIDNLARSTHADPIVERDRTRFLNVKSGSDLWQNRGGAYPNLLFGPGVEDDLAKLNPGLLRTVANKLGVLDKSADDWKIKGGAMPSWGTKVTDESDAVKNDHGLLQLRQFRSDDGTHRLFTWHARYGSGGRIHLRFDPESREVEVGYVGPHLKLP